MAKTDLRILSPARQFVQITELPAAPRPLEALERIETEPVDGKQVVTVGSQLLEFSESAKADLKAPIQNSILFAQLAANKATESNGDIHQWYEKYSEVLFNLGWLILDQEFVEHEVSDTNAELHEAIIPIISMVLGPQVAAASIVVAALKGLKEMNTDEPWITLFERESKRFESALFQVSYVDVDQQGVTHISLLLFTLNATTVTTQVLFFKFSDASAVLRKSSTKLALNTDVINMVNEDLKQRLKPYLSSYISSVEI